MAYTTGGVGHSAWNYYAHQGTLTNFEDQIHAIEYEAELLKAKHSKNLSTVFAYLNYQKDQNSMLGITPRCDSGKVLEKNEEVRIRVRQTIASLSHSPDKKADLFVQLNQLLDSDQGQQLPEFGSSVLDIVLRELSDGDRENQMISPCLETLVILTASPDFGACERRDEVIRRVIEIQEKCKTINAIKLLVQVLANCSCVPADHTPIMSILDTLLANMKTSKSVTLHQHSLRCVVNLYINNRNEEALKQLDVIGLITPCIESQLKSVREQGIWCLAHLSSRTRACFKGRGELVYSICELAMHGNILEVVRGMAWICLANFVLIDEHSQTVTDAVSKLIAEFIKKGTNEAVMAGTKSALLYGVVACLANMVTKATTMLAIIDLPLLTDFARILNYGDFEMRAQVARVLAYMSADSTTHQKINASGALDAVLDLLCAGHVNASLVRIVEQIASNVAFLEKLSRPMVLFALTRLALSGIECVRAPVNGAFDELRRHGDQTLALRIESMLSDAKP